MREQPTPGGLIILVVWGFISYLFGFPLCLLIFFVGAVVIFGLIALAEYSVEQEGKKSTNFVEKEELPAPISELPTKKVRSRLPSKNRPKIRIESKEKNNSIWKP